MMAKLSNKTYCIFHSFANANLGLKR